MRAINYFKNRFQFAINNSGTIKVNQNDVNALNDLITWANGQGQNTQLEDSLLLFWIFSYWTIEIQDQKPYLKHNPKPYLQITNLTTVMDKLCTLLSPKNEMIKEIALNLQSAQMEYNIPTEKLISENDVSEMLEDILQKVKNGFRPISDLNKFWDVKYTFPAMTEAQKEMMTKFKLINIKSADHILHYLLNFTPKDILDEVRQGLT